MALPSGAQSSGGKIIDADGVEVVRVDGGAGGTPLSVTSAPATSATATETSVASSASNVTLLASNTSRKGFSIYNDSTAILYVKFGATATSSSYTIQMAAGSYYESPALVYTGKIDGIWASANGNARLTELT